MKYFTGICLCVMIALASKAQNTPYIFSSFNNGNVLQKGGGVTQAQLNYNLLTQELCFIQDGKIMVFDQPSIVDTIYILDKKLIPVGSVYYEKLTDTKVSLWVQNKGTAVAMAKNSDLQNQQNNVISNGYGLKKDDTGTQAPSYNLTLPDHQQLQLQNVYYLQKDKKFYAIDNLKKIVKLFPGKETQINNYIKDNKLDTGSKDDLKKLIVFCNQ